MVYQHFGISSNTEFITLLPEIKMAVAKPEVVVSRPTCHLEMEFQRLYLCSHGLPTLRNIFQHGIHYPPTRNQDGGCKTGSSCKSAYMPLRNGISTAIPMFSWSTNTSEYLPTRNSLPSYQKSRWRLQNRK